MDYLDPHKRLQNKIMLLVGYVLVAIAILGGALVLLFLAYGFGLSKDGQVIQKGLVFVSSQPNPAKIYLNGNLNNATTNTKLLLTAGRYTMKLQSDGYRTWQRAITVEGGDVQHFDYPMLFPVKLTTNTLKTYSTAPVLATQSPDRRWLVIAQPEARGVFDLYDLNSPSKAPVTLTLPVGVYAKTATNDQGMQAVEWADDNQHVLLKHSFDNKSEFIVLDRQNPDQSVNLNTSLGVSPTDVSLNNKKFDQYYLYNAADHSLTTATLNATTPVAFLDHVLAYKSYGSNTVLYATDAGAPAGQTEIKMQVGTKTYPIRELPAGSVYLLELAQYNGPLYVTVGSNTGNLIYLYKDPAGQEDAHPDHPALPMRAMRINGANYLAFSVTAQFVMAENGSSTLVYDFLNSKTYTYTLAAALDSPQSHVSWMDGDRLVYAAEGKLVVVDYDNTNSQSLMPMSSQYLPFFTPDFRHVYSVAPAAQPPAADLTTTALVLP